MRKIFTVTLLILAAGALHAQDTLYTERFSGGIVQNTWYAGFAGDNMTAVSFPGNPSGDGWVGDLLNDLSGGGVGVSYTGDISWTDFYYEAQVYLTVDGAFYNGIEFRVDSTGLSSGYNFVARFNPTFGSLGIRFRDRAGASPTSIKEWVDSEIPGGVPTVNGWHKMAVEANGNQFRLFFDDVELPGGPFQDNTYASGFVGAYIFDFAPPMSLNIDDVVVTALGPTGIEDEAPVARGFELLQNYPNPFNPTTTIAFTLTQTADVDLTVYNGLGQAIRTVVSGNLTGGEYKIQWDGKNQLGQNVTSGVYVYRLRVGTLTESRKMVLLR